MGLGSLGAAEGLKELASVSSLVKWVECWVRLPISFLQAHRLCLPALQRTPKPQSFRAILEPLSLL